MLIVQNQMSLHAIVRSWTAHELLVLHILYIADMGTKDVSKCTEAFLVKIANSNLMPM